MCINVSANIFKLAIVTQLIIPANHIFAEENEGEGSKGKAPWFTRVEVALGQYTGAAGTSFAGLSHYSYLVGREQKSGTFRPFATFQLDQMLASTVTLGASLTSTTISYYGFKGALGLSVYPMQSRGMQPFVSASGTFTRGGADASPSSDEVSAFSRPNLYGYEFSVGTDLKSKADGAPTLRLRGIYCSERGTFSGISNFKNSSVKMSLGFGF